MIAEATRAAADRARGIVLSGSAGVGKTRVAREAVAAVARVARADTGSSARHRHAVFRWAPSRIASDFGPDPFRRVREVIDGLVGDARLAR